MTKEIHLLGLLIYILLVYYSTNSQNVFTFNFRNGAKIVTNNKIQLQPIGSYVCNASQNAQTALSYPSHCFLSQHLAFHQQLQTAVFEKLATLHLS